MRVLLAWSGGKDSAWALHRLRDRRDVELHALFTAVHDESGKVAVHGVPGALLRRQAQALGLPVHELRIPAPCPNSIYERIVGDFVQAMKREGVTHVAFGDLFLEDIRAYRERQFAASGVELLFPLWGADTALLAREMTAEGLRAWITCVDVRAAPAAWAGRIYDAAFVEQIPPAVDPCGENGEFHTFVFEGPMLAHPVPCAPGESREAGGFVYADLRPGK